jgi:hypothetical protein
MIAQADDTRSVDAVEQRTRRGGIEHRRLPARHDVPWPAHRHGRVDWHHLVGDGPVEQVTDRGEPLLDARRRELPCAGLDQVTTWEATMADEEHLAILRSGVEKWNAWREANPSVRPSLSGANLEGERLSCAPMAWEDLQKRNFLAQDRFSEYHARRIRRRRHGSATARNRPA